MNQIMTFRDALTFEEIQRSWEAKPSTRTKKRDESTN